MAASSSKKTASRKSTTRKAASRKSTARKSTTARKPASAKRSTSTRSPAARGDKSVEAYRDALERSVTLSRDWLQEVFDDAVKRGRMTRKDANELVNSLLTRGRKGSEDLVKDLERMLTQARRDVETRAREARTRVESRTGRARKQVAGAAGRAARSARDAGDTPLARADRLRRRAGVGSFPISAYDELTAAQVKRRLGELSKPELRKVRTYEKNNKARKGILDAIEKRLAT
jgi:polyhydroxyalkanoate synthesis regulator phasin